MNEWTRIPINRLDPILGRTSWHLQHDDERQSPDGRLQRLEQREHMHPVALKLSEHGLDQLELGLIPHDAAQVTTVCHRKPVGPCKAFEDDEAAQEDGLVGAVPERAEVQVPRVQDPERVENRDEERHPRRREHGHVRNRVADAVDRLIQGSEALEVLVRVVHPPVHLLRGLLLVEGAVRGGAVAVAGQDREVEGRVGPDAAHLHHVWGSGRSIERRGWLWWPVRSRSIGTESVSSRATGVDVQGCVACTVPTE